MNKGVNLGRGSSLRTSAACYFLPTVPMAKKKTTEDANSAESPQNGKEVSQKKRAKAEDATEAETNATSPATKKAKKNKKPVPEPVTEIDPTTRKELDDATPRFKVVSWNVDGLRAPGRREALDAIVKAEAPDVLFLQATMRERLWMTLRRYIFFSYRSLLSILRRPSSKKRTSRSGKTRWSGTPLTGHVLRKPSSSAMQVSPPSSSRRCATCRRLLLPEKSPHSLPRRSPTAT